MRNHCGFQLGRQEISVFYSVQCLVLTGSVLQHSIHWNRGQSYGSSILSEKSYYHLENVIKFIKRTFDEYKCVNIEELIQRLDNNE